MMNFYINALMGRHVSSKRKQAEIKPDTFLGGKTPRIGVIVNPLSGGNLSGLGAIRDAIADYPAVLSSDVETPADIAAALADFARKRVNLLAVNGGDGTVQAVLTTLFHHQPFETLPLLMILQSGTTSMIAGDVGMRGSRVANLQKLFKWVADGDGDPLIVQRPILRVQTPGDNVRCGMFFGAAGVYEGILHCRSKMHSKGLKGEVGPGFTFIRFLWAMARKNSDLEFSVPITVAIDDHPPQQFDGAVLLVSTLERLLLGFHPFWSKGTGPLRYTAVRAHPRHLLGAISSILRGRQGRHVTPQNGYFSHNARQIRLNLDSGFTLDGQLYRTETPQDTIAIQSGGTATFLRF